MNFKLLTLAFFLLACGCTNLPSRADQNLAPASRSPSTKPLQQVPRITERTVELTAAKLTPPAEMKLSEKKRIPVTMNESVQKWIDYFTIRDRARFQRFLDRGQKYRDVVENVLEENDLPAELYYLAMIESGYQVEAHSHAHAKGVWQFIPGTATRYGLRVDKQIDERRDPIRSTEAAAKYLRDLYNVFGSWPLAMGAYNAGEIRILRAVFRGKTRDFWKLVDAKVLPRETAEYFPKFLAVVLIGMDPTKYGFNAPSMNNTYPEVESVSVPGGLSLAQIAKTAGVSPAQLAEVNPHLSSGTPFGGEYEMWVPTRLVKSIERSKPALARLGQSVPRQVARQEASRPTSKSSVHIVRRGENLTLIAQKYKISVGHLKRMNNLRSNKLYVGAKLTVQPKSYKPNKVVRYIVRRGDNLTFIAKKFNTTVSEIRKMNQLRKNQIMVGQSLRVGSL